MLYRHKGARSTYRILHESATMQCKYPPMDDEPMVVYQSVDNGSLYVRPVAEFYDGRFEHLPEKPDSKADPLREALQAAVTKHCHVNMKWPATAVLDVSHVEQFLADVHAALASQPATAPVGGREERLAKLLKEARQYVSDAGTDEDGECRQVSDELCSEIDAILAVTPGERGDAPTVHEYIADYEYRGDQDHVPTEDERAMLEDAIEGYLASTPRVVAGASVTMDAVRQTIADEWGSHLCWRSGSNFDRTCDKDKYCRCADIARAVISQHTLFTVVAGADRAADYQKLLKTLNDILDANDKFRAQMPEKWEWDGDPLQDACDAARALVGRTRPILAGSPSLPWPAAPLPANVVDRAAVIEECAKVADNFASFEETAIERVYADPALSESVRKDINHSAGSRQVAAEQIAHDIRALNAGKVGEGK